MDITRLLGSDRDYETRHVKVFYEAHIDVLHFLQSQERVRFTHTKRPWWAPWRMPVFSLTGPAHAIDKVEHEVRRIESVSISEMGM